MSFDDILDAAQSLSEIEQTRLIDALVRGLPESGELQVSPAWWAEIDRRTQLHASGQANFAPLEDAMRRASKAAGLDGAN